MNFKLINKNNFLNNYFNLIFNNFNKYYLLNKDYIFLSKKKKLINLNNYNILKKINKSYIYTNFTKKITISKIDPNNQILTMFKTLNDKISLKDTYNEELLTI
jgi:hypothetical protein